MLFDLKGRRKRLVQVVYVMLAILFGGGLVLFGVGGNVSGGLVDAFRGGGDGSADNSAFTDAVDRAKVRAARNPDDPNAWLALVRAEFNLASSPAGSDAETGALTDRGQQAVVEVSEAWERYEKLDPKRVDPSGAAFAALAFGALQDYDKAVDIQDASLKARPSPNGYFQLADFAYRADQVERGDAGGPGSGAPHSAGPAQHSALPDQGPEEAGQADRGVGQRGQEGAARGGQTGQGPAGRPKLRAAAGAAGWAGLAVVPDRPRPIPIIAGASRAVSSTGRAGDS